MFKKKIFWKRESSKKKIYINSWQEDIEYYTFLKMQSEEGFKQVTFLFSMMLGIIEKCAENPNWILNSIEMMEEDFEFQEEINFYIERIVVNRGYYSSLIKLLTNYCEGTNAEIKRINISNKVGDDDYEEVFIQINGLMGVSKDRSIFENEIQKYLEEIMN